MGSMIATLWKNIKKLLYILRNKGGKGSEETEKESYERLHLHKYDNFVRNWKTMYGMNGTTCMTFVFWREIGVRFCERQLCMEERIDCLLLIFWSLLYAWKCNGCLTWWVCNNRQGYHGGLVITKFNVKIKHIGLYIKLVETV